MYINQYNNNISKIGVLNDYPAPTSRSSHCRFGNYLITTMSHHLRHPESSDIYTWPTQFQVDMVLLNWLDFRSNKLSDERVHVITLLQNIRISFLRNMELWDKCQCLQDTVLQEEPYCTTNKNCYNYGKHRKHIYNY